MSSTHVQTTLDYLNAFKQFSGFDVDYVHATHHASLGFDFDQYDVVFHNYCSRLCFEGYVSESYRERMRRFAGVKVLSVQDEYDQTDALRAAIKDLGFDIVLTCVPQDSLEYVYPRADFPNVEFITVFTGYVPDDFVAKMPPPKPLPERPILIGYRGRDIGGRYGRLGFDKFEIGRRMKELCDARGIETDIAMDEASRIYGMAWFDFVGNCRAMLGSESGSNVFDFDGRIEARFKEIMAANGGVPPSYADFLPIVAERDGEIEMGQISPRVFECALMRTPMVLFKGRYSDAIAPDEHYIPLEKDFSNLDEVLARLNDLPALEAMTGRAFDHLVGSGQFTYRSFYGRVSAAIERKLAEKAREPALPQGQQRVPVTAVDAAGFILEPPTPTPLGEKSFKVRQDVNEAVLYRREFDRLIDEFERLRIVFGAEMPRLLGLYARVLKRFGPAAEEGGTALPSWSLADCDFTRLLQAYDDDIGAATRERQAAAAAFRDALSAGAEAASGETLRRMLEVEKDGYFRMIEWIRQLNETYNSERLMLERAYFSRIDQLSETVLPNVPLGQQATLRLMLLWIRLRSARTAVLRALVKSAALRRLFAALPGVEPLAKRIAARLRLSGLT